jgi:hypothetical protein
VPPERASALLGPDWLDLRFPPVDGQLLGCRVDSSQRTHSVFWSAAIGFADAERWGGHSVQITTEIVVPESIALTVARIDSALAARRPTLDEVVGESPTLIERTMPARSRVRLEHGALHLRLEGEAIARALLRPKSDTLRLLWCRLDRPIAYSRVPLVRTTSAAPP